MCMQPIQTSVRTQVSCMLMQSAVHAVHDAEPCLSPYVILAGTVQLLQLRRMALQPLVQRAALTGGSAAVHSQGLMDVSGGPVCQHKRSPQRPRS